MTEDVEIYIKISQVSENDEEISISTNVNPVGLNWALDKAKLFLLTNGLQSAEEASGND